MATLYHDGDLRRVYEVPEDSTFTVDSSGYRRYVPNDIDSAEKRVITPIDTVWSRWVDYHFNHQWSTLAYTKAGGEFRFRDEQSGVDVFQTYDLRLINDWLLVPADYPHVWTIEGNLLANINTGADFDVSRIQSTEVSPRINLSESLQTIRIESDSAELDEETNAKLDANLRYTQDIALNMQPH